MELITGFHGYHILEILPETPLETLLVGSIYIGRLVVLSLKIVMNLFPGPMISYPVKENHVGSAIARSFGTDRHTYIQTDKNHVTYTL